MLEPAALASLRKWRTQHTGDTLFLVTGQGFGFHTDFLSLFSAVYFAALVLTLSQQMTSDRINLYPSSNSTLW